MGVPELCFSLPVHPCLLLTRGDKSCVLQPCHLPRSCGNVLTPCLSSKRAQACRTHLVFSTSALNLVLNQRLKDCSACCSKQDQNTTRVIMRRSFPFPLFLGWFGLACFIPQWFSTTKLTTVRAFFVLFYFIFNLCHLYPCQAQTWLNSCIRAPWFYSTESY